MLNEQQLEELLAKRGLNMGIYDRTTEDIPAPPEGLSKLMDTYYVLKNTADMEIPYWYNRVWWENDGEVTIVRRAKAMAAALSHVTPTI